MGDLSDRAREALAGADLVAAEDTRRTLGLLQHLGLAKPLLSLHSHNESQRLPEVLARLANGARVVLVSDAGTPLLSDPGFELVRAAVAQGIPVGVVPGPSAITRGAGIGRLAGRPVLLRGFLPAAARERRTRLSALAGEVRTMVFFEAPHRIADSLVDLSTQFGGERPAVIARELTKLHETVYRGTLEDCVPLPAGTRICSAVKLPWWYKAPRRSPQRGPESHASGIGTACCGSCRRQGGRHRRTAGRGRRSDAYDLAMQLSRER